MELDIGTIITLVITAIATFAGGAWAIVKGKLKKVVALIKEAYDLVAAFESALQDDKVDKKEIEGIKKEFAELKGALKALVSKE